MRLAGKIALISGAARGIGAAIARLCAAEGAKVMVGDILDAEGQGVVADLVAAGGEARFVRLDVASEAEWQQAVDMAVTHFGGLHILVNNAGTGRDFLRVVDFSLFLSNRRTSRVSPQPTQLIV